MLKGRRIIFVLGNLELGGAERQALILARYLSEHEQAKVEFWGFNKSGPLAALCEQHGLRWRVVPYHFTGTFLSKFRGLLRIGWSLRQARPDILLPYTFGPNVVCGLVWKWTGARCCVWNQRDEGIVPFRSPSVRWAAKQTSHFISNCEAGARYLIDKFGISPAKVTVIRNGVDTRVSELDQRAWRERLEVDAQTFVACMVANLHLNKDHATLFRAWRKVVDKFDGNGRGALLVLAGRQDAAYESLVSLATELKIHDRVRFMGEVSDVFGLLNAANVSVFSSRSEGCPNSVLESMAAGLPVAGTDIEGIREMIGPAGKQFLAPVGDPDSLADALVKMATDPALCARLSAENRDRIRSTYETERMCRETVAVLTKVQ